MEFTREEAIERFGCHYQVEFVCGDEIVEGPEEVTIEGRTIKVPRNKILSCFIKEVLGPCDGSDSGECFAASTLEAVREALLEVYPGAEPEGEVVPLAERQIVADFEVGQKVFTVKYSPGRALGSLVGPYGISIVSDTIESFDSGFRVNQGRADQDGFDLWRFNCQTKGGEEICLQLPSAKDRRGEFIPEAKQLGKNVDWFSKGHPSRDIVFLKEADVLAYLAVLKKMISPDFESAAKNLDLSVEKALEQFGTGSVPAVGEKDPRPA